MGNGAPRGVACAGLCWPSWLVRWAGSKTPDFPANAGKSTYSAEREGGIRTLDGRNRPYRFSRPAPGKLPALRASISKLQYLKAWHQVDARPHGTASSSVAVPSHWRGTSERPRVSRSLRSPSGLGRAPATIKAYFYDPTGEKARAVKARYVGVCRGCGAYTQPRNGKGDAYAYCKACHPGAIERRWTRERVLAAMAEWRSRYGRPPSSSDWSRTHARRRGGEALERLARGDWPAASVVTRLSGTWAAAGAAALPEAGERLASDRSSASWPLGSNSISLPNPRESTARSEDLRPGAAEL